MTFRAPGIIVEGLSKVVTTAPVKWTILSRIAVAMALLLPAEMRIANIGAWCSAADEAGQNAVGDTICQAFSLLEVVCAFSYLVGGLTRLFALPAMAILAIKALSGLLSLWPDLRIPGILARGDWAYGAAHIGALTMVMDLIELGSGLWSVDYLLSVRNLTTNDGPTNQEIP